MDAFTLLLLALVLTTAGASVLYLGSPRQVLLARPLPSRASLGWGLTLLLAAWLLWCLNYHPATAFFATLILAMTLFVLLPAGAALLRRPASPPRKNRP